MINFRYKEESDYLNYCIGKMCDSDIKEVLALDSINSETSAEYLANFFWRLVDFSIQEEKAGVELFLPEGREFWNEKLMTSISAYLEREGYEEVWDRVVDLQ